ncbi:Uncharacterized protein FWK35_00033775 [Aphis craccivora]|uniref:MULE domain-containing protein n=1 Tax=Aphis craccivora TaxID=307492 RepID=A0A6G0VU48_APHCR|nr:Uncharacterized protein FWK35_00033775 [Aphis craccivora]
MAHRHGLKRNTKRNKRCISIENYTFSESHHLKNGSFRFRCTNRKCTQCFTVQCVRTAVKRKAEEDLHARPNKIIRGNNCNDIKLLRGSAYRIRKKHFSKIPTTINEALDQLFDTQVDIKTSNNEQFCFVNREKQIILFTCTDNLKHLCESENIFGDGTFIYAFLISKSEDQYMSTHRRGAIEPDTLSWLRNTCVRAPPREKLYLFSTRRRERCSNHDKIITTIFLAGLQ